MNKNISKIAGVLTGFCVAAFAVVILSVPPLVLAAGGGAGGGNDGGSTTDPGCLTGVINDTNTWGSGTLTAYDSCGAGFKLYNVSDSSNWPKNQDSYINSNVVPVCSQFGGDFYYLSLHRVKLNSAGNGVVRTGQFSHRRQVKNLKSVNQPGGNGHIPYIVEGGALAFSTVYDNHEAAIAYADAHPEYAAEFASLKSTPWADITWFCWNEGWANPAASGFTSKSKVTDGSTTKVSSDWGIDAETLEIEASSGGSATVYFSHNLKYSNSDPDEIPYQQASTTGTITFDDGSGETYTVPFSADGANPGIESGWKTSDAGIEKTITLADGEEEKTVCSTIAYTTKTVNWSDDNPHVAQPVNDTGSTKACVKITRPEVEDVGGLEFWSRSHVESVAANDVKYHKASTYDNFSNTDKIDGDKVTLRLSTDYTSAKANFSHDLGYVMTLDYTINANDTVEYDNMCTNWKIESAETSSNGNNGTYCANAYYTGSSTGISTTSNHTVNLGSAQGAEGAAEEKITFQKKRIPILRKEDKTGPCYTIPETNTCSWNPKRYIYYAESGAGSGSGSSSARIEYVRPTEPDGNGPSSSGNGTALGGPMYAGESSDMQWTVHAKPNDTRRIMEYRSIVFLVQVSRSQSSANVKGSYQTVNPSNSSTLYPHRVGQNQDPCAFWASQLSPLRSTPDSCVQVTTNVTLNKTFPTGATNESQVTLAGESANLAVPDWVGDKYCNSFGYKWEYYYGIMNTKGPNAGSWTWTADNQPYWVHYNAACRTIAKKPAVALWNGGLFIGAGNAKTSTSPRRIYPNIGVAASALPVRHYGSWAEYLANVNGSVGSNGALVGVIPGVTGSSGLFSSGAAYAWDGSDKTNAAGNSTLTIQNSSEPLGFSSVTTNSALMERFEAYFKSAATNSDSIIGPLTGINDSLIYYVDGSVNINGNIILSTTAKNSIYQIPQVVIFATGDINIQDSVQQIDAWLISKTGKIDTCYNSFITSSTQARVNGNPLNSANTNRCQDKLIINGPVFAKSVTTTRSFGSDGVSNSDNDFVNASNSRAVPSETFNLSAGSYLWAYAQAGRYSSSYTEAYSRELPPRY